VSYSFQKDYDYEQILQIIPNDNATMTAEGEDECIPGTMYWGCESKFHKLCCEADQRPSKRPWSSVIEYIVSSPEEAAKFGVEREGSNKLTPLVSTGMHTVGQGTVQ
jgi:hypothetical protein